jgi:hypothetical protein
MGATPLSVSGRKEELERRLEQSRRLSKETNDPTTRNRLDKLIGDLKAEQKQQEQDDKK